MPPDIVKCPQGDKITLVVKHHYSRSIQPLSAYCIHARHFAYVTSYNLNGMRGAFSPLTACKIVGVGRLGFGEIKGISKSFKGTQLSVGVCTRAYATVLTVLCCLLVGEPGTATTGAAGFEAAYTSTRHKNG